MAAAYEQIQFQFAFSESWGAKKKQEMCWQTNVCLAQMPTRTASFPTRSGKCKRKQINYQPLLYEQASASDGENPIPCFSAVFLGREWPNIEACQGAIHHMVGIRQSEDLSRALSPLFLGIGCGIGRNYCPGLIKHNPTNNFCFGFCFF